MAKKNSSKTATQEALKASEPRLQTFTGWQGVNFRDAPLGWDAKEVSPGRRPKFEGHDYAFHQSDLKSDYLLIQNNMVTTSTLTLETRPDAKVIAKPPTGMKFTGVSCLFHRWLFCVCEEADKTQTVYYRDILTDPDDMSEWHEVVLYDAETHERPKYKISELNYYQEQLIALTYHRPDESGSNKLVGEIFSGELKWIEGTDTIRVSQLESAKRVPDPTKKPRLRVVGQEWSNTENIYTYIGTYDTYQELIDDVENPAINDVYLIKEEHDDQPANTYYAWMAKGGGQPKWEPLGRTIPSMTTRVQIYYCYVNKYGTTLTTPEPATIYTQYNPVRWSSSMYLEISGEPGSEHRDVGITGVDIYCTLNENSDAIYIGHVENGGGPWEYNWYGAMSDISQWTNAPLTKPTENTTKGVTARYFSVHDSRLYFWGDPEHPYRLWIGGNPGAELSIARGLGGGFVDIEPGSGIEIHGTEKWKTTSGANIITMLCGNPNTNRVKRFNLVETSITVTNEISSKGWMYEEVSNVVGCNSRWGHGVFADGLYTVSRYGLMLTTMAMEYNAQMRNTDVSAVIQPIFTERLGERLNDARLIHIDGIIYIILSEEKGHASEPTSLDRVILCYDIEAKAWYTFTHGSEGNDDGLLLHAMTIDSEEHEEGLGIISENAVTLYPTTGIQDTTQPAFDILIETGELTPRTPQQGFIYLCQLEFRFDYFIGKANVRIEGVDYYGRDFVVEKELNKPNYEGEMRSHIEYVRVDKHVQSYRIQIKGRARCRLTHINAKVYQDSARIGLPYGFDSGDSFINRHHKQESIHHYIEDYNNLRKAIVT